MAQQYHTFGTIDWDKGGVLGKIEVSLEKTKSCIVQYVFR